MSNLVFPVFRSLEWDVERTPAFNNAVQKSVGGRRVAVNEQTIPLHSWTMSVCALDKSKIQVGQIYNDFARLEGFFKQLLGSFDSFLYEDPTDYLLTAENIGTGDGSKTAFQVTRDVGGYKEAIYEIEPSPVLQVFVNDWEGNQLQYSTPRTNLCFRSEQMDDAAWGKTAGGVAIAPIVTANTANSPRGDLTADRVQFNLNGGALLADQSTLAGNFFTSVNGQPYRLSVWLKSNDANTYVLALSFNGQVNTGNCTVTPVWQRFDIAGTGDGATKNLRLQLRGTIGTSATADVLVWGADMKADSALSSYIPTLATAVTVTDYSINSTGMITFAVAPLNLAVVTVTGEFYWRCVFPDGSLPFNNFSSNLWEVKTIAFEQLKP